MYNLAKAPAAAPIRFLSLFSGIEACSVAWKPLGWECAAVAEIEPFPCAVLPHHYPTTPNLGDVTKITDGAVRALGRIDVVVGGSPCQDLSVAGKRAGLAGARSSLFHEQLRIFHAARHFCGARFLLWENVPGAFSSNRGADFAVVVGSMAGCVLDVPVDGWGTEGVALGENGLVEWAVLDAQWFGVAQRRRRVFAVLDVGNWADRPPILLEPDSLRGDSAPRRETGEKAAPTLAARTRGGGGLGTDFDLDGGVVEVCPTLRAGGNKSGGDRPPGTDVDTVESLICMSSGQANAELASDVCTTLHEAPIVAHTLRGDGFDASEDGTGRGTPLVPVVFDTTQITSPENRCNPQPGDPCHPLAAGAHPPAIAFDSRQIPVSSEAVAVGVDGYNGTVTGNIAATLATRGSSTTASGPQVLVHVDPIAPTLVSGPSSAASHGKKSGTDREALIAFSCKDHAADAADDLSPTLRSMGHDGSHANGGGQIAVAFHPTQDPISSTEACHALGANANATAAAHVGMAVRRLTPRECERLQGFPDDYTLIPWKRRPAEKCPDGPRYKALGNSMAVPVMRWIGQSIVRAVIASTTETST